MNHFNYFKNYSFLDNPVLVNYETALNRGNLFNDLYVPYRNYSPGKIVVNNKKEAQMLKIQEYAFALNELGLYLDLHPDDYNMLNEFIKTKELYLESLKEFESEFYPIKRTSINLKEDYYEWLNNWPTGGKI